MNKPSSLIQKNQQQKHVPKAVFKGNGQGRPAKCWIDDIGQWIDYKDN